MRASLPRSSHLIANLVEEKESSIMPPRSDTSYATRNIDSNETQSRPQDPRKCCVFLCIVLAILVATYLIIPFDASMRLVFLFFGILPTVVLLIYVGCYILRSCTCSNEIDNANSTEGGEQSSFYIFCRVRQGRDDLELASNTWFSSVFSGGAQSRLQKEASMA